MQTKRDVLNVTDQMMISIYSNKMVINSVYNVKMDKN